jgi:hypothetical protein
MSRVLRSNLAKSCGVIAITASAVALIAGQQTSTPVFTAQFKHDGTYRLSVVAVDRYGMWSKPREIDFSVAIPKPDPLLDRFVSIVTWLVSTGAFYFMAIFPLILLYPHFSWARTATNSGVFTKFPFCTNHSRDAPRRAAVSPMRGTRSPVPAPPHPAIPVRRKDTEAHA